MSEYFFSPRYIYKVKAVSDSMTKERKNAMYMNPDIYNPDNLNKRDKARLDSIEHVKQNVLNEDVIEDFIEEKVSGTTLQRLYRDILNDFTAFLKERVEYCKVDLIVDAIEGYSDAEFEKIYEAAKSRKGEQNDNSMDEQIQW